MIGGRRMAALVIASLLLLPSLGGGQPSSPPPADVPGSELAVTLITFGLGEQVFERFGHNALWIHDATLNTDAAYDWGNFSFEEPGFLRRFLTGDTRYWMASHEAGSMIEAYRRIGRPVTLQRLNLTAAQAVALRDFLRWNALDENRFYRYDYFVDNCSTRLRDALDRALGGALRVATDSARTPLTYRRESVRLTDGDKPVQAGIDIALGRPADAPLTPWQSFFIPMRLRDGIRDLELPADSSGRRVRLVADERSLAPASGTPVVVERAASPRLVFRFALSGLTLAALVVVLRVMAISRRGAAWGLALVGAGWSLLCGVIGSLVMLAWFGTKHVFWAWNENLLQLSPISLALVALVPLAVLRERQQRSTRALAALVVWLGILGALLAIVPGGQENRAVVALFLPVHLALAWSLLMARPAVAGAGTGRAAPTN